MSHHTTPIVLDHRRSSLVCDRPAVEALADATIDAYRIPVCNRCRCNASEHFGTFVVSLVSPLLDGPFEVEVVASSASAAIARTRMVAFHQYRNETMLTADCTVEVVS
jgi:hypothetical protein